MEVIERYGTLQGVDRSRWIQPVIMGRKTWDSLPDSYRPLPERVNIVMSRDTDWQADGAETALYVGRAIELAYAEGSDECWIIGGAQVYEMFLKELKKFM